VDRTGTWIPSFLIGVALMLVGLVAILLVDARRTVDVLA
jgi:hypothetical protein